MEQKVGIGFNISVCTLPDDVNGIFIEEKEKKRTLFVSEEMKDHGLIEDIRKGQLKPVQVGSVVILKLWLDEGDLKEAA
jgi:hypothetical protein